MHRAVKPPEQLDEYECERTQFDRISVSTSIIVVALFHHMLFNFADFESGCVTQIGSADTYEYVLILTPLLMCCLCFSNVH